MSLIQLSSLLNNISHGNFVLNSSPRLEGSKLSQVLLTQALSNLPLLRLYIRHKLYIFSGTYHYEIIEAKKRHWNMALSTLPLSKHHANIADLNVCVTSDISITKHIMWVSDTSLFETTS